MFRSLLAASAMTAAVALTSPALAGEHAMPRTISLSGHGEVRLAPDTAIVNLGVASQAPAAKDALAANTTAMQSVFAALKAAGIEDKDVQTSNFMVQPRYNFQDGKAPELVGYDVSNNVTVRFSRALTTAVSTICWPIRLISTDTGPRIGVPVSRQCRKCWIGFCIGGRTSSTATWVPCACCRVCRVRVFS